MVLSCADIELALRVSCTHTMWFKTPTPPTSNHCNKNHERCLCYLGGYEDCNSAGNLKDRLSVVVELPRTANHNSLNLGSLVWPVPYLTRIFTVLSFNFVMTNVPAGYLIILHIIDSKLFPPSLTCTRSGYNNLFCPCSK